MYVQHMGGISPRDSDGSIGSKLRGLFFTGGVALRCLACPKDACCLHGVDASTLRTTAFYTDGKAVHTVWQRSVYTYVQHALHMAVTRSGWA